MPQFLTPRSTNATQGDDNLSFVCQLFRLIFSRTIESTLKLSCRMLAAPGACDTQSQEWCHLEHEMGDLFKMNCRLNNLLNSWKSSVQSLAEEVKLLFGRLIFRNSLFNSLLNCNESRFFFLIYFVPLVDLENLKGDGLQR